MISLLRRLRKLRPLLPSEHLLEMAKKLGELRHRPDLHPVLDGLLNNAEESVKQAWMIERQQESHTAHCLRRELHRRLRVWL